jgi:hypothetical protein
LFSWIPGRKKSAQFGEIGILAGSFFGLPEKPFLAPIGRSPKRSVERLQILRCADYFS